MDRPNAMLSLLSYLLPVVACFLPQTLHLLFEVAIRLACLNFAELHEDLRVVCRGLPLAKSKLGTIPQDISVLLLHETAIFAHLLEYLAPDKFILL